MADTQGSANGSSSKEAFWRNLALAVVGLLTALLVYELTQTVNRQNNLGQVLQGQQATLHRLAIQVNALEVKIDQLMKTQERTGQGLYTVTRQLKTVEGKMHGLSSTFGRLRTHMERKGLWPVTREDSLLTPGLGYGGPQP
jgi:hypothetical protein